MKSLPLRERILRQLQSPGYRPLDKVGLSQALRWPHEKRGVLKDMLQEMETAGEVAVIRDGRYVLPQTADLITGTLQVHAGGNAHLLSTTPGKKDMFISASNIGTAMHGDKVVARLEHGGRQQRAGSVEGRVIKILERANTTIVGTLQCTKKFFYVIPDDSRLQRDISVRLPGAPAADGPVVLGKKGERDRAPRTGRTPAPQVGDKVVVRLDEWENQHVNPEGEIIEVLGRAGDQGVDMLSIIRKHHLPLEFPGSVEREAERISETIPAEEIARREDLRGGFVITIDPDDAKDFDDAINVERTAHGWHLGVHIADVSHYVRPGSALDKEARARGNSTYLADRVIPMLPERLSNGICSLKPGVERLTFSAFIEFDAAGRIRKTRFARTVIKSAARLTYRQAFAILENREPPPTPNYERGGAVHLAAAPVPLQVTPELRDRVQVAWELASLLRRNRFEAGSLDLEFPEVKIWLDDQGRADRLEKVDNDISHQLIEECMLAANEVVAHELKNRNMPAIYRIHEDPDNDRLMDFRTLAATYGFRAGDITQRRELQTLLASTKGSPEEYAIKLALLKSLKRAVYGTEPIGHYGLAKVNYTHFTSPIRRYADLLVHRALARISEGRPPARPRGAPALGESPPGQGRAGAHPSEMGRAGAHPSVGELSELATHISTTERASADAEKDSTMLKKMEFFLRQLASKKPTEFRAHVVDVRSYGLSVELPDVLVSGLIHVSTLPDDFYTFDSVRLRFIGRKTGTIYKVGDTLTVIVSRVDAYKRQIDFVPTGAPRSAPPSEQGSKGRGFGGRRDEANPGVSKRARSRKRR